MKLYHFIGYLLRPFAVFSLHVYSYALGTPRARVVLENEHREILLIQTWLSGNTWCFPGGGAGRGESAVAAAVRELHEETGIILGGEVLKHSFTFKAAGHDEVVFLTSARKSDLPEKLPSRFEVKNAGWFSLDELPLLEPYAQKIVDKMAKNG